MKLSNIQNGNLSGWWYLRVAIGWHFLYEGMVKVTNPNWSSVSYLLDSEGWLKGLFYNLAANPDILKIIDFLNVWGLIAIGLGLILGSFSRVAIVGWNYIVGILLFVTSSIYRFEIRFTHGRKLSDRQ